jgi:hydroxymethylpyrimidine/phosphomethylpyrimidine kinase
MKDIRRALTIAGSDSGGGAGIQADLKTFTAFGVFGMSVLTSITAQNTEGVLGIFDLPPEFVHLQLKAVLEDIGCDVVKTGMLSNSSIIEVVADDLKYYRIEKLVVDPVMRAKGGDPLLRPDAQEILIKRILPLSTVVTPNLPEAEVLSGISISSREDMMEAARRIKDLGPGYVLIKGGHLSDEEALDILFDGRDFHEFSRERIKTPNTHGTGCTYASAIAAGLALGWDMIKAIERAKTYVTGAIKNSLPLGKGHGPVNHFWNLKAE